jgi:hypothetical protein
VQIPYKLKSLKRALYFSRLFLSVLLVCSLISCSSSSGVDDYYTFNVVKSQNIPVTPQIPVGQDVSVPFPISVDSTDFITSPTLRTSLALIKSVKLTKLAFTPSDASYPMTSFDTVRLFVSADSLADQTLATYFGFADSLSLTDADFAAYMKKPSSHYTVTFRANKAPAQAIAIAAAYTLVFTATPLQ